MSNHLGRISCAFVLAAIAWCPATGAGQETADELAESVRAVGNGTAWIEFTAKPDVWGDGKHWNMGSWFSARSNCRCTNGPVLVGLAVESGRVTRVRSQVGGKRGNGASLGEVPSRVAADYLVELASWMPEKSAEEAIQAAVAARDADVWPALLDIARDRSRPADVRSTSLFWVAQEAGDVAAASLEDIATASDEDSEVQNSAVFAITQLPGDRGTDLLLQIARENRNPKIVESVYFWLGQSGDPRATDLFEEVLLR